VADFLGISSLGTGSVDGKLVGIPEEFKDFTSMFTLEYDSIKENLKDKDGNPISLEEYLNELHTYVNLIIRWTSRSWSLFPAFWM
jgi:hypothetical protein